MPVMSKPDCAACASSWTGDRRWAQRASADVPLATGGVLRHQASAARTREVGSQHGESLRRSRHCEVDAGAGHCNIHRPEMQHAVKTASPAAAVTEPSRLEMLPKMVSASRRSGSQRSAGRLRSVIDFERCLTWRSWSASVGCHAQTAARAPVVKTAVAHCSPPEQPGAPARW